MTCTEYEGDLALYVEGDLARAEAGVLEQHLGTCPRCQGFVRELEATQGLLRAVAADTLDAHALTQVRARVRAALDERKRPSAAWAPYAWGWALAASLVLAAWVLWNGRAVAPRSEPRTAAVIPAPSPIPSSPASPRAMAVQANPATGSTSRRAARVFIYREPKRAPAYGLSDEDADQLARAVVTLAGVERLPYATQRQEALPARTLVRVATADPDVVIYWQLDANGG